MKTPKKSVKRSVPRQTFRTSFGFVLGIMAVAGLCQHLYLEVLIPKGLHEQSWIQGLAAVWGVVLLAGIALFRKRIYQLMSSVRTSVAILSIFTICCVAGSFVLQKRDLDTRGLKGEKAYSAFRLAEAGFIHYMMKGQNYRQPMSENGEAFFAATRERFGDKYADERLELFHKVMGGRSKDGEIKQFADDWDPYFRKLWDFCTVTRLYDIHRSWAFVALMSLLSICLIAGTYKRFVWRADQIGFYSTHLGFVVLMVGFTLSMGLEERGILPLEVGKALGEVWEFNSDKPLDLGFQVYLQDFYTERHHEVLADFTDIDHQARGFPGPVQRSLKAHVGTTYELYDGKYSIKIADYAEYGSASPEVQEQPDGPLQTAVQIDVDNPEGAGASGWLFAGLGSQSVYADPTGRFVLSLHENETSALKPPTAGDWGTLWVASKDAPPLEVAVQAGTEFDYDGKHWKIEKVVTDFARRDAPLAEQEARNPAVLIHVNAPGEKPQIRWNFAWIDFDSLHTPAHPEVTLRYEFRSGNLKPDRVVNLLKTESGLEAIRFDASGTPIRTPVPKGKTLPLGIEDFTLKVSTLLKRAKRVFVVKPIYEQKLLELDRQNPPKQLDSNAEPSQAEDDHAGHNHAEGEHAGHNHGEEDSHAGHNHGPGGHDGPANLDRAAIFEPILKLLGPLTPDVQRRFHPPGPPAVKLEVKHPGGTFTRWFLSGHPEAGGWKDDILNLRFGANPNKVKEWRSLLVATDGKTVRRQVVRVNTTMEFGGWTMYQTDADPKRPNYSGIQVLKDPGWYFIEPGLIMVCFGVIFMFWIKPWMRMDQTGGSRAKRKKVAKS